MATLNWKQVYDLNSTTTFNANDVFYLARSPYGVGNDYGFLYSSLVPVTTKGDLFTFSSANARLGVGANGTILTPDSTAATGLKWTTATYPATTTINQVLYSSSANVVSGIATSNGAIFVTDSGGVPSTSYQLPIGVMQNITTVGTISAGLWNGTQIGEIYGGTGLTTYTLGDTIYSSASNTLAKLAGNSTIVKMYLSQTGTGVVSAAPTWSTISGLDIVGASLLNVNDTNVTLTLTGSPGDAVLRSTTITAGWSGQLSLARGGSGANLIASDGALVYSNTSTMALLAPSGSLNNILLTSLTGAPHWSSSSFPDTCSVGNMLYCATANIWSLLTPTANAVLTSNGSGVPAWSTTLVVGKGGTGTSTQFTTGSVVYAGASGVYSQDNATFFWDSTNKRLGVGTNSPTQTFEVNGICSVRNGTQNFPAGIVTELSTDIIDFGINDSLLGTQVTSSQGSFIRCDARAAQNNIQFYVRNAGNASASAGPFISAISTSRTNFGLASVGLFTNDTDGFPYIPTMFGTPTGTPTAYSGLVPIVYDTSANKLWIYSAGWKGVTLA